MFDMRMRVKASFLAMAAATAAGCGSTGAPAADPANAAPTVTDAPSLMQGGGMDLSPFGACATTSQKAEVVPVDLMLALDTSDSMLYFDKWTNVKEALGVFLGNGSYTGIGVGVQFFPLRFECDPAAYAAPAVPITLLPDAASKVEQALAAKRPFGGTPTVDVIVGVTSYLQAYAKDHPGRKEVIVLATDGVPDETCLAGAAGPPAAPPNSLANAVAVTAAAAKGSPSIATFVIGVGSDLGALQQIAQAGGTGSPIFVDMGSDIAGQFAAALASVRQEAVPCDYNIPAGAAPDPTLINVGYSAKDGGAEEVLTAVPTADDCARAPRSYYFDDPHAPSRITLCPAVCADAKSNQKGKIDIVYGCATMNAIR
jgi:hypothetical protein